MRTLALTTFLVLVLAAIINAATPESHTTKVPDDLRAQQIKDMKWGMFICWSFSTFSGSDWTPGVKTVDFFKATDVDTEQWCETAKAAGMKYILFLTKHHDGFCLWDTKTTDRKVTNAPLGRDVLAELKKSCDKHGIKLALYFSEGDWTWNGKHAEEQREIQKAQLKELCTEYGPIEFWWIDHAVGTGGMRHSEKVEWIHKFQPNSMVGFNHGEPAGRICLRELGRPGKIGDPNATKYNTENEQGYKGYLVGEFTYPILGGGGMWFYPGPKSDNRCRIAGGLYAAYLGALEHGNIFSLNVAPNYEGRIRDIDVKTLTEVGEMIKEGMRRDAVAEVLAEAARSERSTARDKYRRALLATRDIEQINTAAEGLKKLGEQIDLADMLGFITKWQVIGPFDNVAGVGFAKPYPPETTAFQPNKKFPGKHGEVGWQTATTDDPLGKVDLNAALNKEKGVVAYARAEIKSNGERPVDLRLSSSNANKVWLNGEELGGNEVYHSHGSSNLYVFKGRLLKGDNVILVKICQNEPTAAAYRWAFQWRFSLRVMDQLGWENLSVP